MEMTRAPENVPPKYETRLCANFARAKASWIYETDGGGASTRQIVSSRFPVVISQELSSAITSSRGSPYAKSPWQLRDETMAR